MISQKLAENLLLAGELVRLVGAFQAAEIPVVVLKGVPLVRQLYGRLDGRTISDNDLLVPETALERVLLLLAELGYEATDVAPRVRLRHDRRANFTFTRAGRTEVLDLHLSAFDTVLFNVPSELVWTNTRRDELEGHSFLVLNAEMTLLHLAAHFVQHNAAEVRILQDLARAWNDQSYGIVEERLFELAQSAGLLAPLVFALDVAANMGMLRRAPPTLVCRNAKVLSKLLPPERLFRAKPRDAYLRPWLLMPFLLPREQWPTFARYYLLPPVEKLTRAEPNADPNSRLQALQAHLTRVGRPVWHFVRKQLTLG